MKTEINDSKQETNAIFANVLVNDFLINSGFVKETGKFGEYFKHQKYELFRCWFFEGKLQLGK